MREVQVSKFPSTSMQRNGTVGVGGMTTVSDDMTINDDLIVTGDLDVASGIAQTTDDANAATIVTGFTDTHTTTGVAAAGIGSGYEARTEITGGNGNAARFAGVQLDVTAGANISAADVQASRGDTGAGAYRTAFRARHPAATAINFLEALSSPTGVAVIVQPSDGAGTGIVPDADVNIQLSPRGTGTLDVTSDVRMTGATPTIQATAAALVIQTTNLNDNISIDPAGTGALNLVSGNFVMQDAAPQIQASVGPLTIATTAADDDITLDPNGTGDVQVASGHLLLQDLTPNVSATAGPLVIETLNANDDITLDPAGTGDVIAASGHLLLQDATPNISATAGPLVIETLAANDNITMTPAGAGVVIVSSDVELSGATPYITATAANEGIALRPNGTGSIRVRDAADGATVLAVQNVAAGVWGFALELANDAALAPDRICGSFLIGNGAGAAGVVVTCTRIQAGAIVLLTPQGIDAGATVLAHTATAAGASFTVTSNANVAGANLRVSYLVINPAA